MDIHPSMRASHFPHRHNPNGTYDSICPVCLATVATRAIEAELDSAEAVHHCDPSRLSYLQRRLPELHKS